MSTLLEKVQHAINCKNDIKNALNNINEGVITDDTPFDQYAAAIPNSVVYKYQLSEPVNFTLDVTNWMGSNYELVIPKNTYKIEKGLHIDIPVETSSVNKDYVVKSALTIQDITGGTYSRVDDSYSDTTVSISSVSAPDRNLQVSLYGLVPHVRSALNPFTFTKTNAVTANNNRNVSVRIQDEDGYFYVHNDTEGVYIKSNKIKINVQSSTNDDSITSSTNVSLKVYIDGTSVLDGTYNLSLGSSGFTSDYIDVPNDNTTIDIEIVQNN